MVRYGRLYKDGGVYFTENTSRPSPTAPARTDSLPPAYAWVSQEINHVHSSVVSPNDGLDFGSFYPGIAMGNAVPAIEEGEVLPLPEIAGPEDPDFPSNAPKSRLDGSSASSRRTPAARVVGSLEHAILPMPPVKDPHLYFIS